MSNRKLHARRAVPYETTINWTLCQRNVEREQIAAFDDGVTCKNCRKIIDFNREWEQERARRTADAERLYQEGRTIITATQGPRA